MKLVGEDDDGDGGGVGGAGGLADSFNHTSGPRQFTSFCHQVCQERRTARELKSGSRGGAGGVAGECVQRKLGGWGGLWYFDWVRALGLMCEAKSQYESQQGVGTGVEPLRDAHSRPGRPEKGACAAGERGGEGGGGSGGRAEK